MFSLLPPFSDSVFAQLALVLSLMLSAVAPLRAQMEWQPVNNGIYGAVTVGFGFGANGEVFAATQNGIYRLAAGKEKWEHVLGFTESRAIVSAPGGVMVAGGKWKMFRSVDNGTTWEEAASDSIIATKLLVAPYGTLFALTTGRTVRRSEDTGKSWKRLATNIGVVAYDLAIAADRILAVATGEVGRQALRVSTDGGESWLDAGGSGNCFTVVRTRDDTLVAGTSTGIRISGDGINWVRGGDLPVHSLHPSPDGYLYAIRNSRYDHDTATDGIHRSSDNGRTWSRVTSVIPTANTLAVGPDGVLWIYSRNSIFTSSDHGESWSEIRRGLTNTTIAGLEADSTGRLYLMLQTQFYTTVPTAAPLMALYSSNDNGESWEMLLKDLTRGDLEVHRGGHLFVSTDTGEGPLDRDNVLLHSTDGGIEWRMIPVRGFWTSIASTDHGVVAVGSAIPDTRDWGVSGGGILLSLDNGRSWKETSFNESVRTLAISSKGTILVGMHEEGEYIRERAAMYRSTDLGATWATVEEKIAVHSFGARSDGYLFAAATTIGEYSARLQRSSDDGKTWEITYDSAAVTGFTFGRQGTILGWNPALRSTDDGATWSRMRGPTPYFSPEEIIAAANGDLFARGWRSLYRSTDDGRSWQTISDSLDVSGLPDLVSGPSGYITPLTDFTLGRDGHLFVGTAGQGLYRTSRAATSGIRSGPDRHHSTLRPDPLGLRVAGSTVSFVLARSGDVDITIYTPIGEAVTSIARENLAAGEHAVSLEDLALKAGVYLLQVRSGSGSAGCTLLLR